MIDPAGPHQDGIVDASRRALRARCLFIVLSLSLAACTRPIAESDATSNAGSTGTHSPSKDKLPMNQTTHPDRAEDIGRRVLKLVENIRSADDIAPARIEQLTGIKVEFNPDDANEYGFGGQLTDAWAYNLVSLPDGDAKPTRLMFSFDDESRANADMAPICALDFDAYADALAAAGYRATPAPGKHGEINMWDFTRDDITVQVYVRGENDDKAEHACVSKLIVNA